MDVSLIVNTCLSISSFLLSFISVIILVVTIRQNHLMIENESRAYLAIYGDIVSCQGTNFYLILKNFGKSNALIVSMECDTDLSQFSYMEKLVPFSHMGNASVAPRQSFKCSLQQAPLFNSGIDAITFRLSYKSNGKKYDDTFCINLQAFKDLIITNASTNGKELKTISHALQDINRKML